jgi:DNA repair photolyase
MTAGGKRTICRPCRTTVMIDTARSIITRNDSPDIGFDRSINPYRGCEHGCVYCYARPSHNYLGLSAGVDFETKLFAKPDAARLLEQELRRPSYRCKPIAIGTNTDPYQPIERKREIMRQILTVLSAFRHPVTITTKSALVVRDLDILAPMIPALTDHEMEAILTTARDAGAKTAGWLLLRLPFETKDLFEQWLTHHRPDRRDHILSLIRQARGGKLNDPQFGRRFVGSGPYVEMFRQRFVLACRKLGLNETRMPVRADLFAPPPQCGDQLVLDLAP